MTYRRRKYLILGVISLAAVVAGVALLILWPSGAKFSPRSLPVRAPSAAPKAKASVSPGASPQVYSRSQPTEIAIPAIGVSAKIDPVYSPCLGPGNCPVDLTPLGTTQNLAGWWAGFSPDDQGQSYTPGQVGPAVIVGHVNWSGIGNLVFGNLYKIQTGDQIIITLADGKTVQFTVSYVQDVLKTTFPTQDVYGPTTVPTLRLVTCTGTLLNTGHYNQNEIVYAEEK